MACLKPDGIIIVPAFFEGGRYTINDVHMMEQNGIGAGASN